MNPVTSKRQAAGGDMQATAAALRPVPVTDKFQWRSIKTRVTLFTLAIFLISILALTFYVSRVLREDMQSLLGVQQFSTVSLLAGEVNQALDERLRLLEALAGIVSPAMLGNTAALRAFLQQRPRLQSLFNDGVIFLDADGTVIAEAPFAGGRIGVNFMDHDGVAAALKEGQSTIGRPQVSKGKKSPEFIMAVPIRDTQGKVIGAFSGVSDLGKPNFLDRITEGRYGTSGSYLLVAPQYRLIVTASDKSRTMEALPASGINPMIDRFIQGYEGSAVLVNPLGVEVLASAKRIPVAGWYVSVALPTAEAFAPMHAMQQRMLLATIFFTLLAGGLTWLMIRRQLAPMLAAVKTLAALSGTNQFSQPLPIARQDEIGELIAGFNRLLETLKQREGVLLESEARHRAVIESALDAIIVNDEEGRVTEFNPAAERTFGYRRENVVGKDLSALFIPDKDDGFRRREFMEALTRGVPAFGGRRVEVPALHADGHEFPIELTVQRIDWGGRMFFTAFARDITERNHARIALEQASRMKSEFMANVTHELRTPLNSVIGFAELLKNEVAGPLNAKQAAFAADILAGGQCLLALVEGILEMSRLDAYGAALKREPVEIGAALEERVAAHRKAAEAGRVSIAVEVAADAGRAELDPKALRRLLDALLDNAIKFNREGGTVALSARRHDGWMEIAVADTGIGIAREDLAKLFKPLVQLDAGLARRHGGVGLGLALSRRLAELHDGTIEVESERGKGSTFTLRLPVQEKKQ